MPINLQPTSRGYAAKCDTAGSIARSWPISDVDQFRNNVRSPLSEPTSLPYIALHAICTISSRAYNSSMAKKTTLDDIAKILTAHGKEIRDLTASVSHVVKHMATKDDIAELKIELKGDIARVQEQVNSIEAELKYGRYESRLGKLEEKVFGAPRH